MRINSHLGRGITHWHMMIDYDHVIFDLLEKLCMTTAHITKHNKVTFRNTALDGINSILC